MQVAAAENVWGFVGSIVPLISFALGAVAKGYADHL